MNELPILADSNGLHWLVWSYGLARNSELKASEWSLGMVAFTFADW